MSQIHDYPVSVQWKGGRAGSGTVRGGNSGLSYPIAVGTEFGGPGGGTNPEELLTNAVTACYAMTFGIIAENRKIPVVSMETKAVGEVEQSGMQFTYKKITIRPRIVLDPAATDEQMSMANDMAHKAELYCIVTNAVRGKVEVVLEPEIVRG